MDNVKKFKEIANSIGELYEKKNRAYGNSFGNTYKRLGIISAVTRISDKYERLCTIAKNPDIDNLGESLEDTLKDLAAYSIMTLIELDNNKPIGINVSDNSLVFKGDICISPNVKQWDICISPDTNYWDTSSADSNDIKVGDKFLCINTVIDDEEQTPYVIGKTYTSEFDGCITNEMGNRKHEWANVSCFSEHFKRIY